MDFIKTTEQDSKYDHLEIMEVSELIQKINAEDQTVAIAVEKSIPQIVRLTEQIILKLQNGGRLFYIGAGTSGRLGILDASECPPTFGIPHNLVIGLIAGGDAAIRKAVEFAEDSLTQGWEDLQEHAVSEKDVVVGIAASGTTPYVIAAIQRCNEQGILTGCITCNKNSHLSTIVRFPIEVVTGPEFITGSSRMKAGTAQKMVLNMITTATMIQLGKVKGNKMVDMQLSNNKLLRRGILMLVDELHISEYVASLLLEEYGSVRNAIKNYTDGNS